MEGTRNLKSLVDIKKCQQVHWAKQTFRLTKFYIFVAKTRYFGIWVKLLHTLQVSATQIYKLKTFHMMFCSKIVNQMIYVCSTSRFMHPPSKAVFIHLLCLYSGGMYIQYERVKSGQFRIIVIEKERVQKGQFQIVIKERERVKSGQFRIICIEKEGVQKGQFQMVIRENISLYSSVFISL